MVISPPMLREMILPRESIRSFAVASRTGTVVPGHWFDRTILVDGASVEGFLVADQVGMSGEGL